MGLSISLMSSSAYDNYFINLFPDEGVNGSVVALIVLLIFNGMVFLLVFLYIMHLSRWSCISQLKGSYIQ